MEPQKAAPQEGKEPSQAFAVIARLEMDEDYPAFPGPKLLRIVSLKGTGPASDRAVRSPGGGPV